MIIQIVKFKSVLPFEKVVDAAKERTSEYLKTPGLLQRYYVRTESPDQYAGVFLWDSAKSMKEYRDSDLAAGVPQAYQVTGPPEIEIYQVEFTLRD
jgi:heme-degrading monooxygenase HmoA